VANVTEVEVQRRALRARHRRGAELITQPDPAPLYCEPQFDLLTGGHPAEVTADRLTPGLLRAAILRDGCLLVRRLLDPGKAEALAGEIERAFEARDAQRAGVSADDGLYEEFEPDPGFQPLSKRAFVERVGIWTADSPALAARLSDDLRGAGMSELMASYLGEEPVLAVDKCTLRRSQPGPPGPWHQDGAFMGDVRTLDLWIALTPCGEDAPGLDVVARRIEHILPTGTQGAKFDWSVSPEMAEGAAGENGIVRPRFDPGDAMLFDDLCVHRPGSNPTMRNIRYAVETWFFGPAGFPAGYTPLAV
jgi:hypothetical protein